MNFESILTHLRNGERCARSGWNGKGMWVQLIPSEDWAVSSALVPEPGRLPWLAMWTGGGALVPWTASQSDILGDDWALASRSVVAPIKVAPTGIEPGKVHNV